MTFFYVAMFFLSMQLQNHCLISSCDLQSQVFRFLKTLREKGKKLFLLTNSPFYFVDGGMSYLLEVLSIFKYVFCALSMHSLPLKRKIILVEVENLISNISVQ